LGSLPLGYLNLIGVSIFTQLGTNALIIYLSGVVSIEAIVIYCTVIFVNYLTKNTQLMKNIDFFAVFFLLVVAYLFYLHMGSPTQNQDYLHDYIQYSPFLIGMVLCGFNFLQIPFWMGWNMYLTNANYVSFAQKGKFYYLSGTLIGTFLGMLSAIVLLHSVSQQTQFFSNYLPIVLPLFFIVLAIFQAFKVYKKYLR
jgi:hypothetical protein